MGKNGIKKQIGLWVIYSMNGDNGWIYWMYWIYWNICHLMVGSQGKNKCRHILCVDHIVTDALAAAYAIICEDVGTVSPRSKAMLCCLQINKSTFDLKCPQSTNITEPADLGLVNLFLVAGWVKQTHAQDSGQESTSVWVDYKWSQNSERRRWLWCRHKGSCRSDCTPPTATPCSPTQAQCHYKVVSTGNTCNSSMQHIMYCCPTKTLCAHQHAPASFSSSFFFFLHEETNFCTHRAR